jgi:hypothetical protein
VVAPGNAAQGAAHFQLALREGQVDEAAKALVLGDVAEELVDVLGADPRQHVGAVLVGMGEIAHR